MYYPEKSNPLDILFFKINVFLCSLIRLRQILNELSQIKRLIANNIYFLWIIMPHIFRKKTYSGFRRPISYETASNVEFKPIPKEIFLLRRWMMVNTVPELIDSLRHQN